MASEGGELRQVLTCLAVEFLLFSSRRRHTRFDCDWSSDVCSSDLRTEDGHPGRVGVVAAGLGADDRLLDAARARLEDASEAIDDEVVADVVPAVDEAVKGDRKSTRLNSSHSQISYAVFCLKKKNTT